MDVDNYIKLRLVHTIHTSERRSFRSCRRRWDWAYRQYYYPLVTPKPLEFGVAYHEAMQVWYDPDMWSHPDHHEVIGALAATRFSEVVKQQLKNYAKLNGEPGPEVLDDYKERVQLGLEMIKYYTTTVSPELDKGFKPLAVEIPFEVPLGLWCKCDICYNKMNSYLKSKQLDRSNWVGLPVTYGGRIDMVVLDEHGRLWLWDHKTTIKILDEDAEAAFLQLDDQVSSYCWALHQLNRPVAGFIYHEQRKAVPRPPEPLTRLYKGRSFSTSKTSPTTFQIFKDTVMLHDRAAYYEGVYNDYLEWLLSDGPKFYQRHQIHKNAHEIASVGHYIKLEAQDIIGDPRVYPQPGRFSCNSCLYRQPCLGVNMGEDYRYTLNTMFERRERHYYEEKANK